MKIAHFSDLHYSPHFVDEVDRCFSFGIEKAIAEQCECAVISGDLFDHRVEVHEPCVSRLLGAVSALASAMPVLILQGTFSHDQPGSLDVFKTIKGKHPVHVADRIQQVMLTPSGWAYKSPMFQEPANCADGKILFSCLPPVNKGAIAAVAGTEDLANAAGEFVYEVMRGFAAINSFVGKFGIPSVVVSHGTVNGCMTEHGVPMHGNDHEFTTGTLFSSEANAIMLGHIHQQQYWFSPDQSRLIAYPGSIGRLHFGEVTPKGFLVWDVNTLGSRVEFVEVPAKRLIDIQFDGVPDLDQLKDVAAEAKDAHVRIRWNVDEDLRHTVDRKELEKLFDGVAEIKLEGRVNPIQRQRAAGISKASTLAEKLVSWLSLNEIEDEHRVKDALDCLSTIQLYEPVNIVADIRGESHDA